MGKHLEEMIDSAFVTIMSTRQGRQVIWSILENACVFSTPFNPEAVTLAFNVGQQNQGLQILARITRLCPEKYLIMTNESKEDRDYDDRQHNRHTARGDGGDHDDGDTTTGGGDYEPFPNG